MVEKYEDPFVRIASMIGGDEYLNSTGLRINLVRKILYDLFGKSAFCAIVTKR